MVMTTAGDLSLPSGISRTTQASSPPGMEDDDLDFVRRVKMLHNALTSARVRRQE